MGVAGRGGRTRTMARAPISPAGSDAPSADPAQTRTALAAVRPGAVRTVRHRPAGAPPPSWPRLWGAFVREPLPGVVGRDRHGLRLQVPAHRRPPPAPARPGRRHRSPLRSRTAPDLDDHPHDDPATLLRTLEPPGRDAPLAAELANSVANLALARAATRPDARDAPVGPPGQPPTAAPAPNSSVVDGHPLHPCCRTRGGMSLADVLAYGPEAPAGDPAARLRVPAERWYGDRPPAAAGPPVAGDPAARRASRGSAGAGETDPVRAADVAAHRRPAGRRRPRQDRRRRADDLRAAHRLTAAVHNGPRLSALLGELTADLPLTVLAETAAGAVVARRAAHRGLAHLRRQALPGWRASSPYRWAAPASRYRRGTAPLDEPAAGDGGDPTPWSCGRWPRCCCRRC